MLWYALSHQECSKIIGEIIAIVQEQIVGLQAWSVHILFRCSFIPYLSGVYLLQRL